jgi:hypothetical protein
MKSKSKRRPIKKTQKSKKKHINKKNKFGSIVARENIAIKA